MTDPSQTSILSLGELLHLTMEAYNRETIENNQVVKEADSLEAENTYLKLQNHELREVIDKLRKEIKDLSDHSLRVANGYEKVKKNAEDHMTMVEQANREKIQMADKLSKAEMSLSAYKAIYNTPKKCRDAIKGYKDKTAVSIKAQTSLKAEIKQYRKEANVLVKANKDLHLSLSQSNITTIWSEKGDHLMLFPAPLTMAVNGKAEKQLTLLFMNQSGCGKLIGLGEEGEPLICKMPAGGLKPKKATLDKAGTVLRRFKKRNWEITHQDLLSIREQ